MNIEQIYNKLKEVSKPYHVWINQIEAIAKWVHAHYEEKQNPKEDERKKIAAILFSKIISQFKLLDVQNNEVIKAAAKRSLELTDILLEEINNKQNG